ncbi:MAG: Dihydroorotate dehydrogenase (NAD(+)), electron transfer subunit, partial [uncultured Blastococcus sp.]
DHHAGAPRGAPARAAHRPGPPAAAGGGVRGADDRRAGDRRADRAGPVRRLRRGRPDLGPPAAPVHRHQHRGGGRGDRGGLRGRTRVDLAHRTPGRGCPRRRRPARPWLPDPAAGHPGPARRGWLRVGGPRGARRPPARAGHARGRGGRRRDREPALLGARPHPAGRCGRGDHRRRHGRASRPGDRCGGGVPVRRRRGVRLRPHGDAAGGLRRGHRPGRALLRRRRGIDGLRDRGVHDLRPARRGGGRAHPLLPLVHRGSGVRGRPGALRRRRHPAVGRRRRRRDGGDPAV